MEGCWKQTTLYQTPTIYYRKKFLLPLARAPCATLHGLARSLEEFRRCAGKEILCATLRRTTHGQEEADKHDERVQCKQFGNSRRWMSARGIENIEQP